jgi:chromate transport protein ChrA
VSVGYFVAEILGAIAGWLAMITPAVIIIRSSIFRDGTYTARAYSPLQAVIIASAGLLLATLIPLARDALTDPVAVAIAAVSLLSLAHNRSRYAVDHFGVRRRVAGADRPPRLATVLRPLGRNGSR